MDLINTRNIYRLSDREIWITLCLTLTCGWGVVIELFLLHEVNAVDQKQGWTLVFLCLSSYLNVHWSCLRCPAYCSVDWSRTERPPAWHAEQSGRHFWYTQMFYFYECGIKPMGWSALLFHSSHIAFIRRGPFHHFYFLLFFSLPLFFFCFLLVFRLYFSHFRKRNIIYCQLTLWSRDLLQNLTVAQRVSIYAYKSPLFNVNFM